MNPRIQYKDTTALFFLAFTLGYLALSPVARAVLPPPPPDGGYPGGNTAEGDGALSSILFLGFGSRAVALSFGNTALGYQTLSSDTTGNYNTATGDQALFSNTTGGSNTATGYQALYHNLTGTFNTATGYQALHNYGGDGSRNTATGYQALSALLGGSGNTAVGAGAGNNLEFGNDNIYIGSPGPVPPVPVPFEDNIIRIGDGQVATYIAGINGTGVTGAAVVVNGFGQLGVAPSSQRFKAEIEPIDKVSEVILALKPVTFRYKKELDPEGTPQFGLVAEEVEKVNPDLVARDAKGKVYTVRYEAVNAMLLNEFLKEHRKVEEQNGKLENQARRIEEQDATITQLKKGMETVIARLGEQDSKIRQVSKQLELSKPAPQMVATNQ